ncbi:DUF2087 domain-containing protein [Enterococcus pallens]|uniref:HTH luxR-type domain-containing protein n=1 Tax=Enterococcus pallens ATCC BAA-351 TaxID=1158607 RepID=R2Q0X9_9ENTE|nr:hypothetical protein UAU_04056 [Enterococcus pallens ATCC BAA-351]EOU15167.1 hypothetical protein I588_04099 [Enterococcus pallens ATCC BAA-351]
MDETIEDYQNGYRYQAGIFSCLYCKQQYEEGYIYPIDDKQAVAQRAMIHHLNTEHAGALGSLIAQRKEISGLSEIQQEILELFARKLSDSVIAQRMGISTSTVRNHRFKLREKEKQAKVFLSIMSLLNEEPFIPPHRGARMIDERYHITPEERNKVLATYFTEEGRLTSLPSKEKRKVIVLTKIVERFDTSKNYSEAAVNEILQLVNEDFVTLRRYLIEYGFMNRTKDGQSYWVVD